MNKEYFSGIDLVKRNMRDRVNRGQLTKEKLKTQLENAISELRQLEDELQEILNNQESCNHEFLDGINTVRLNVVNEQYRVRERSCKKCKFTESYAELEGS